VVAIGFALLNTTTATAQVHLAVRGDEEVLPLADSTATAAYVPAVSRALKWRVARPGLEWAEVELLAGTRRLPLRAVIVRIEPARFRFDLRTATSSKRRNAWTIDSAGVDAAFAVNAGQFKEAGAWGWVRIAGRDRGLPGSGSLAYGVAFDSTGVLHWIAPDALASARRDDTLVLAFQSYPMLIVDGAPLAQSLDPALVDQDHRDARLIMMQAHDGSLLFVLTRFDGLGKAAARVPIGLTVPESIVLARALDARYAVMLDGGISAQMYLRDTEEPMHWRGFRSVPLGLVAVPR